jgi:drug/metabolite transporter (DMT)-like permease
MVQKLKEFLADFSLVTVAVAWGSTFVIVQEAVATTPVYSFLFLRFGFAFLLLLPFFIRFKAHVNAKSIISGMILGVMFFTGFATQTYGLLFAPSSVVAFITGLNVILVPIFLFVFFHQKASIYSLIGVVIAAYGLYLLTATDGLGGFGWGELLALLCAACFAIHIVFTSIFSKKHNPFVLVMVQLFTVAFLSFCFSLYYDHTTFPASFDDSLIVALVVTALFATVYALLVQTYMQRFTTPTKTAIIFAMEPLSAAVMGYLWAAEILSMKQLAGGALIIVAMLSAELGTYYKSIKKT